MDVSFRLSSPAAMRVIGCIHGNTADGGPDAKPSFPPRLSQLSMLIMWVTRNSDRRAGIPTDPPDFSALQPDRDVPVTPLLIVVLGDDGSIRPGTAAKLTTFPSGDTDVVDECANGYHVQRQTIPPPRRLRSQHARIDDSSHAVQQILRDARSVALYRVTSPHPIRRNDVGLLRPILGSKQCNVRASSRVVLDPLDDLPTWRPAGEVNRSNPPLMPTAPVPDRHSACVVSTAEALTLLGQSEW